MIFILFVFQEFVVLAYVVVLVIVVAGEHKTQRACRELPFVCPDAGRHEESLVWPVEHDGLLLLAVGEEHLQRSRGGDDQLPALLVGVGSAVLARGDIVDVEDALDGERYLDVPVDVCQAAAWVFLLGQREYLAVVDGHIVRFMRLCGFTVLRSGGDSRNSRYSRDSRYRNNRI